MSITLPNFEQEIYENPLKMCVEVIELKEKADESLGTLSKDMMDLTRRIIELTTMDNYIVNLSKIKKINNDLDTLHNSAMNIEALAKWYDTLIKEGYMKPLALQSDLYDGEPSGKWSTENGNFEKYDNAMLLFNDYDITQNDIDNAPWTDSFRHPLLINFIKFHEVKQNKVVKIAKHNLLLFRDDGAYYIYHTKPTKQPKCPACGNGIEKNAARCTKCGCVISAELKNAIARMVKDMGESVLGDEEDESLN